MLVVVVAMGFTRQAAAIGFLMLAFAAFSEKSLVRFLIFVALATTFHKTAVIAQRRRWQSRSTRIASSGRW